MLKIRLMRIGSRKRPFYRVVAVDERAKRTGGFIESLGTYNPLTEPKEIKLNQERINHWVKQGAQLSVGFLRIIGKAPQRVARKPKKEKKEVVEAPKEAPKEAEVAETESTPKEETAQVAEETPVETTPEKPVEEIAAKSKEAEPTAEETAPAETTEEEK